VRNVLKRRFDLAPALGLAILITFVATLALELGFEDVAAVLLFPGVPLLALLIGLMPNSTVNPALDSLVGTLGYLLPLVGWWLIVRIATAGWRRWRDRKLPAGA